MSIYSYKTTPKANEKSIIKGDKYRITLLTSRLFRIEYSEEGVFEDRATQTVINREFDPVEFSLADDGKRLVITTDDIEIVYYGGPVSTNTLSVRMLNGSNHLGKWNYTDDNENNLMGTARTLDRANGACELETGIMSRDNNPSILDDSKSLIIEEDGSISPRKEGCFDQYIFCFGLKEHKYDYKAALKAFYKLTGQTPLIPRYALGNWWSRYYAYTQEEYVELMKRFKEEQIPFSVAVIDMDWHLVDIDPKYGSGWTGYTWNKELFPDHVEFLKFLHDEGLKTTLNLHPAEGVGAHEKAYKNMAEAMGVDPKTEKRIEFDITDEKFMENYFEHLHHPMEEEGVDFWWMDWQQGNTTAVPGLDPLWMLNHLHIIDHGRDGKRAMIFSRYSGPGSHRYPIGFSGDTFVTWDSLDFQPYFTANASNIGYGWWSHDIGGHMFGQRDAELTNRWVQLGVFSPICRLHSSNQPFINKEPWNYDRNTEYCMKKFLKLRHELVPYLYTMNYRAHKEGEPIVQPLYYNYVSDNKKVFLAEPEFECKNEFSFGTEMLVSPITKPADKETMCGCATTFLPEGDWYDFFTNDRYVGGRVFDAYRKAEDMPVFVKAGGIVPMAKLGHINDIENPENLRIKVYAGADNTFEMYEDDGETMEYASGKYAITRMQLAWGDKPVFRISKPQGDFVIPERNIEVEFIGINDNKNIKVTEDGKDKAFEAVWRDGVLVVKTETVSGDIEVAFTSPVEIKRNDVVSKAEEFLRYAEADIIQKERAFASIKGEETAVKRLANIYALDLSPEIKSALTEIITADTYNE